MDVWGIWGVTLICPQFYPWDTSLLDSGCNFELILLATLTLQGEHQGDDVIPGKVVKGVGEGEEHAPTGHQLARAQGELVPRE